MRKSKFTDSQIMDAVKRIEAGFGVPDICREMGISTATFYKWRAKYGGMDVSMMSRMKELEEENRRLKKMYLEEKLKAEIVSEALEKSGEAIPTQGDGHLSSQGARHLYSGCVPGI
jgi:putative transposase